MDRVADDILLGEFGGDRVYLQPTTTGIELVVESGKGWPPEAVLTFSTWPDVIRFAKTLIETAKT